MRGKFETTTFEQENHTQAASISKYQKHLLCKTFGLPVSSDLEVLNRPKTEFKDTLYNDIVIDI